MGKKARHILTLLNKYLLNTIKGYDECHERQKYVRQEIWFYSPSNLGLETSISINKKVAW